MLKLIYLLLKDVLVYVFSLGSHKYRHIVKGTKERNPVISSKVLVCVHEWGGYSLKRKKKLKNGKSFNCGLYYQILRYSKYRNDSLVDLTVTMSDTSLCKDLDWVQANVDHFISVDNTAMDFSGYSYFFESIKNKANSYVIISNSSVDDYISDFLSGYIDYMDKNMDVGALGISYSTKMYQSFIKDNFNPHIQSFFILTTIEVINQIVELNNCTFPGHNSNDKRLLIREGEIGISKLVLQLGYNLAVVNPIDAIPFKFTDLSDWKHTLGDVRLYVAHPNRINKIVISD